ncbi:SHOCT domain-containing protein [Nocardia cyriacigeorgica]|uniref:SHOCT domain-containing protein n=1 Tax=Nocardia cyriacigeorgica TaxID=135487 RepID=UPI001893304E|nr:SHOCT domain-containing protein [Nocardia cyriacigeorgica]MBF6090557.1 SHOCT domain-containing protein [Nocardia cyriacigeorgica]MBF6095600.1 SHOCT domain-containing protein [Nocardia cyriacigeorgica]MBF6162935.1 SHOCT domain-containing protein [Nocardia cyriacigeorgica]MBF6201901.1 SHOCT domain-containing protein [Nocardia cyriacigeorgica]MBF6317178.1 SHOCT domain-containing protein [Nocardia cyriacigeorgica]
MMYWPDHGMTGWGYALMIVVMVLAWALVAVAIIAALRVIASTSQRPVPPRSSPDLPEQLLAERFARGEIDDEEFRRRLTALRSGTGRP